MTILIADDSAGDIALMRMAFKKAEFDSAPQAVHNGEEAIAYLKGEGACSDREAFPLPAIMLLDLNMPMKDGFEVLNWLRAQPGLKRLPVIILSASMRMEDVVRAFDLGANAFLVKPATFEELTNMMQCLRDWIRINHFPLLN